MHIYIYIYIYIHTYIHIYIYTYIYIYYIYTHTHLLLHTHTHTHTHTHISIYLSIYLSIYIYICMYIYIYITYTHTCIIVIHTHTYTHTHTHTCAQFAGKLLFNFTVHNRGRRQSDISSPKRRHIPTSVSSYFSIRHTSACISTRQHTAAYGRRPHRVKFRAQSAGTFTESAPQIVGRG